MCNTVTQCMVYAGMSVGYCQSLEVVSFAFAIIFVFEMITKILGLGGLRAYAAAPRERDASAPIRSVSSSGGAELIMSCAAAKASSLSRCASAPRRARACW